MSITSPAARVPNLLSWVRLPPLGLDPFFFPDANARRVVRFNKRYFDPVASGTKTTTIRYDDPMALGPALFVFEDDAGHRSLDGLVTDVVSRRLDQMTDDDARLGPGMRIEDLRRGLQSHYPGLPEDAVVEVVAFKLLATDR
ncbi:ASCH domain-containing protein [Arthrobacter sp. NPDC056886]|uniref:ASCH domain-containing protein n=1 Tax=Arthrobacter sp. NPDC056886 TaxID=3345960 RepID=UPI00366B5F12